MHAGWSAKAFHEGRFDGPQREESAEEPEMSDEMTLSFELNDLLFFFSLLSLSKHSTFVTQESKVLK